MFTANDFLKMRHLAHFNFMTYTNEQFATMKKWHKERMKIQRFNSGRRPEETGLKAFDEMCGFRSHTYANNFKRVFAVEFLKRNFR